MQETHINCPHRNPNGPSIRSLPPRPVHPKLPILQARGTLPLLASRAAAAAFSPPEEAIPLDRS